MLLGHKLQYIHQCGKVPTHTATPELGAATLVLALLLSPERIGILGRSAPGVVVELHVGVVGVVVDRLELVGNVAPRSLIVGLVTHTEVVLPLGIDRRTHVETIEPHLVGIDCLMEESTLARQTRSNARVIELELVANHRGRRLVTIGINSVTLLKFRAVEREVDVTCGQVVDI